MAENSVENSHNQGPGQQFELPQSPSVGQEKQTEQAIEKRQVSESATGKAAPKFPAQTPTAALPQAPPAVQQIPVQDQSTSSRFTKGLPAHDADLIEKEWVQRAKSLVAQTQDDPYKQKNEMSKIKADYIKKRFNKTIPVEENKKK
jgi:hypothetical protein